MALHNFAILRNEAQFEAEFDEPHEAPEGQNVAAARDVPGQARRQELVQAVLAHNGNQ